MVLGLVAIFFSIWEFPAAHSGWPVGPRSAEVLFGVGSESRELEIEIKSVSCVVDRILGEPRILSWGYSGVVFGPYDGEVIKVSVEVLHALGVLQVQRPRVNGAHPGWEPLRGVLEEELPTFFKYSRIDLQSPGDDVVASRLLSKMTGREFRGSPVWLTEDGMAMGSPFLNGPTLGEFLRGAGGFEEEVVFAGLAKWIRISNQLLFEYGVALDLQSPENFIVLGTRYAPELELIDFSFVEPDRVVRKFLSSWLGVTIPDGFLQAELYRFEATTAPYVPLTGELWSLSPEQIDLFFKNLYGDRDHMELIRSVPRLRNLRAPQINHYHRIDSYVSAQECVPAIKGASQIRDLQKALWLVE